MKITVPKGISKQQHIKAIDRCPHCGKEVVFEPLGECDYYVNNYICGQRRCPNPMCYGHLFIVFNDSKIIKSYPPIRLDFDPDNIPSNIIKTFEEAISCHASECFVASAIMIRRTLEEICANWEAVGNNLKLRIKDLRTKILIPIELLDAMDELRILGNDAAHIEAKDYNGISEEEITVAIQFTKEILKSLYQYSSLLEKLRSLKK